MNPFLETEKIKKEEARIEGLRAGLFEFLCKHTDDGLAYDIVTRHKKVSVLKNRLTPDEYKEVKNSVDFFETQLWAFVNLRAATADDFLSKGLFFPIPL